MPGAVYRRPDQRDLAGAPGGRLVLDDGDCLDLVSGVSGQLLADLAGLDTPAPVTGDQVDIQAELPGQPPRTRMRMSAEIEIHGF